MTCQSKSLAQWQDVAKFVNKNKQNISSAVSQKLNAK